MAEELWTGSFCPECGYDVEFDEDGLCVNCGATAVGHAVETMLACNKVADAEIERLTADLATARGLIAQAGLWVAKGDIASSHARDWWERANPFLAGAKPAPRWQTCGSVDVLAEGEVLGVAIEDADAWWPAVAGNDPCESLDRDAARAWVEARARKGE